MPISAVLDRVWPVTLSASDLQGIPKLSIEAVVRGPSLVLLRRSVSLCVLCPCLPGSIVPGGQGAAGLWPGLGVLALKRDEVR